MEAILRLPAVKARVGLGRSTIDRRMKLGEFPKSIPIGGGLVGWVESDIEEWIQQRILAGKSEGNSTPTQASLPVLSTVCA